MATQLHTYLRPQDETGEEVIDKAVIVITHPRIRRVGDTLVAEPLANIWKSRNKYRAGKPPEERDDFNPLQRFANSSEEAEAHPTLTLQLGNNVPDPLRQIDAAVLALVLAHKGADGQLDQIGSVKVND